MTWLWQKKEEDIFLELSHNIFEAPSVDLTQTKIRIEFKLIFLNYIRNNRLKLLFN